VPVCRLISEALPVDEHVTGHQANSAWPSLFGYSKSRDVIDTLCDAPGLAGV